MVTASRRGPLLKARRQRAMSHIIATESGPPETASTSAGAAFQSANRRLASVPEIGERSSSRMVRRSPHERSDMRGPPHPHVAALMRGYANRLALHALLLTIHGRFDPVRGTGIFTRHLAERGTGGFLFVQRRQRLPEPQQRVRRLGGIAEFGSDAEEGFGGVAIFLALEETLAEPVLR